MSVTIHYCKLCHLDVPARKIATALEKECQVDSVLKEGFWGTFRVEMNGEVLYDRWTHSGWMGRIGFGRTPTPDEIVELVRQRQSATAQ